VPAWALGWHIGYNYQNGFELEKVIDSYEFNSFPLESVTLDYKYTEKNASFTLDRVAFPNTNEMTSYMRAKH